MDRPCVECFGKIEGRSARCRPLNVDPLCGVQRMKVAIAVTVMAIASWVLFGPIAAFHHDTAYGVFWYMCSGGEDADPGDFVIFGERFWFFPRRFAMSLAVWLGLLAITLFVVRPIRLTSAGGS
jgi:hypothetical protein